MLPHMMSRRERSKAKVRILADNSVLVRGNVSQVFTPMQAWR